MNEGYTKLFGSIVTSSIWTESDQTRIVWITLLALADRDGIVQASLPGLARVSGVSLADTEEAIDKLLSPDPYSRTHDNEGRRLEEVEGGWRLLNYERYKDKLSLADRREKERLRKHRQRERSKLDASRDMGGTKRDMGGTSHAGHDTQTQTQTETQSSKKDSPLGESKESRAGNRFFQVTREEWDAYAAELNLDDPGAPWDHYTSNGWKISGRAPMKDWKAALRNWKRNDSKFSIKKAFKPESRESQETITPRPFMP